MLKVILLVAAGLLLAFAAFALVQIGPRNVIGMLRYDRRREGDLKIGDRAPDVVLRALDGSSRARLLEHAAGRPLVVVFGSFT